MTVMNNETNELEMFPRKDLEKASDLNGQEIREQKAKKEVVH